jgi:hypothetical protein
MPSFDRRIVGDRQTGLFLIEQRDVRFVVAGLHDQLFDGVQFHRFEIDCQS